MKIWTGRASVAVLTAILLGCDGSEQVISSPPIQTDPASQSSMDPVELIEALVSQGGKDSTLPRAGDLRSIEIKQGTSWAVVDFEPSRAKILGVVVQGSMKDDRGIADFMAQIETIGTRLLLPELIHAVDSFERDRREREETLRLNRGVCSMTWSPILRRMTVNISFEKSL